MFIFMLLKIEIICKKVLIKSIDCIMTTIFRYHPVLCDQTKVC